MNQGGEEVGDTKAGEDLEIVVALDHRVIHPLAMIRMIELKNIESLVISITKKDINSKTAEDIKHRGRRI